MTSATDTAFDNPTGAFTGALPTWLGDATLVAIVIGGIAANALNIYSGAISFNALGFKLPLSIRRAIVALAFGAIGFFVGWSGLHNAGADYNNFLLIIAYWIAPWLAVMFCDMYLRARRNQTPDVLEHLLFNRKYTNWAGPVSMAIGVAISIWLFSNQTRYVGVVPAHWPAAGDLTFEVGFVLTAIIYLTWRFIADNRTGTGAAATAGARVQVASE